MNQSSRPAQVKARTVALNTSANETAYAIIKGLGLAILGSWLIAVSAQVSVPMYPVPMTMQTAAVLLLPAIFGWRIGVAASALYLLQGAAGLPVFANGGAGLARLVGPTGGYLLAFPLAAFATGWWVERKLLGSVVGVVFAMLLGHAVVFAGGVSWLSLAIGFDKAIAVGLTPFLLGSLVKSALSAACTEAYRLATARTAR